MKVIHNAIRFPVTIAVGVIMLVMFGAIALLRIPIQLTPTIEEPEITVTTVWPGASPLEIEREIVDEQEEQLKSLEGLARLESSSQDGVGTITLEFRVGTPVETALVRVSNRLEQVPAYPADADKPVIFTAGTDASVAIAWFVLEVRETDGFEGDISTLLDFAEDYVKPELERVPGVSQSNIFGGRNRELHVIVDPAALAARQVTLNELASALDRENRSYSGGDFAEGKRRYIVRTVGEYESPEDVEAIVVAIRNDVPVYLRDVARAELGYDKPVAQVFQLGRPILAVNALKAPGSNVLEVMQGLRETVETLNEGRLAERGLHMRQVYDETDYIVSAISLVRQSLMIGGLLAVLILLLYLRSGTSTLVVAVAIPVSVVGAFLMMAVLGRTLNVISLAGLAFAVGMVVDNSIVVLENIYRHRQMGKPRLEAAQDGAREVWGAVLASTLTTIAVFVPVVFIAGEVGQLFGDIAIAISCAVALSLLVAITVIPSLSAKIIGGEKLVRRGGYEGLWGGAEYAGRLAGRVSDTVHRITGSTVRRLAVIVVLTVLSLGLSWLMMPEREYLPTGNQNFVFGLFLPPPGYNLEEVARTQDVWLADLRELWETEAGSPEARALPGGGIRNFFFVALNELAFMGARSNGPERAGELIAPFQESGRKIPGGIFVINQRSLFERGLDEGRTIDIELTGPDLERLLRLGLQAFLKVHEVLPGCQARPIPSLELGNPEVRVKTHRQRAAELRVSNRALGFAVSALIDGAKASDYRHEGKEIDLVVKSEPGLERRTHLLEQIPVATPDGQLVTLGTLAEVSVVTGPVQINHVERERTVTIRITPDERTALESAMGRIRTEILDPMYAEGQLGGLYEARLSGTADKLIQTGRALIWNFLLALAITYLLLAALFESFLYPLVILFSVPLAALGGFVGLRLVNLFTYQPLDVLTMLGFIILLGTVVNNAILIVHQSLNHMRDKAMLHREAIRESVRNRIRPIFMSVSTSVCGMLPLVLFPGAGSELYRGLGSVVVGGLIVSTLFTLFLVPAMFSLSLDMREAVVSRLARRSAIRQGSSAGA